MPAKLLTMTYSGTSPAVTFTTTNNPEYGGGYIRLNRSLQPKGLSDTGEPYSYNHGRDDARLFKWLKLPTASLTSLLAFVAAVKGGRYKFALTDYDGTVYTACRILNGSDVQHKYVGGGRHEVAIEIEVR